MVGFFSFKEIQKDVESKNKDYYQLKDLQRRLAFQQPKIV